MGGKTDVMKGRIEQAAGALIGNDNLREKGKTDQAVGPRQTSRRDERRPSEASRPGRSGDESYHRSAAGILRP